MALVHGECNDCRHRKEFHTIKTSRGLVCYLCGIEKCKGYRTIPYQDPISFDEVLRRLESLK